MNPENVRTIVTGAVTAAVGLLPAWLLYRQDHQSTEREGRERAELRAAEDLLRANDVLGERQLAQIEARESELQQHRERYVTLLHVIRKYGGVLHAASATNTIYRMDADANAEVAEAYEVVMLETTDVDLRAALVEANKALQAMIAAAMNNRAAIDTLHQALEERLDRLREQMWRELDSRRSTQG